MLTWEEILQNSPTMKQLFEDKIKMEVAKKDVEIAELKQQVEDLTLQLGDFMLGGM